MIEFKGCTPLQQDSAVVEIASPKGRWDLHSAGEFLGFAYRAKRRGLCLRWAYYDYQSAAVVDRCEICLEQVAALEVTPRDPEMPFSGDDTLEDMVYEPSANSVSFRFWGGMKITGTCKRFSFRSTRVAEKT